MATTQSPSDVPSAAPTGAFFDLMGTNFNIPESDFVFIDGAYARITDAIVGDLIPQATDGALSAITINGNNLGSCTSPRVVGDLHLCIYYDVELIGTSIVAFAGPRNIRPSTGDDAMLPYTGILALNPLLRADSIDVLQTVVQRQLLLTVSIIAKQAPFVYVIL